MKKLDAVTALERELGNTTHSDTVEPSYRSRREWQEIWGIGSAMARVKIAQHVADGRMTRKVFRIASTGHTHHTPHYKAVK